MGDSNVLILDGYRTRLLTRDDVVIIQQLSERCGDYIDIVEGQPVSPNAGREFLDAAPKGRLPESLLKVGLFTDDGFLIGVLEAVPDFPTKNTWHIGLLMLDPSIRGTGVGRRMYEAFERYALASDAVLIQLAVVADNAPAFRFWRACGFRDIETRPPETMGRKRQSVTVMEKSLGEIS